MVALSSNPPLRHPPKYRFVDGLHEATAGDFKRFGEKAVINCTKLLPDEALKLCQQRIETLQAKIKERRDRGQRSDSLEISLEQEQHWATQLSGIAIIKPKAPSHTPKYESLVRDTRISSIVKLGKTKQGVFYLVYTLDSGWKTCSFVSSAKIIKALTFALEQRGKVGATIKEIVPITQDSLKIRFDWNGAKSSICTVADIAPYLVTWNNARLPASDKPSLKEQLEIEASNRGLRFTSILDEDIWCLRVTKEGKYIGGIAIEGNDLYVSRVGYQGEVKARFPKGAIALIADAMPTNPVDEEVLALETARFNKERDRVTLEILSGKKSRNW
jgi:hypothetical protein